MARYTAAERRASATISLRGKPAFPMKDEEHARLALQMLPRAKGITNAQRLAVKARAYKILGR